MLNRLVFDIPVVLDGNSQSSSNAAADNVASWTYFKDEHQLVVSPQFLPPHIKNRNKAGLLFSDIFHIQDRLLFQNFIKNIHAGNYATCMVHMKAHSEQERVLFCPTSQNERHIRGICFPIPTSSRIANSTLASTEEFVKFATIGKMAGSIAHEINNPLSVIRMNAEILLASNDLLSNPDKVREKCQKIVATTDRMTRIVRALRSMSASAQKPQFNWVSFKDIIDDVIELSQVKFKKEAVNVIVHIDNIKNEKYFVDYAQITQALINLLNNSCDAIRHLPEKWIRLETVIRDDFLHLKVIDSGHGVPTDVFHQITNELFSTKGADGLGLGLHLVQTYASSHGGHLGYKLLDNHTCFYIALPLSQLKPEGNPLNRCL